MITKPFSSKLLTFLKNCQNQQNRDQTDESVLTPNLVDDLRNVRDDASPEDRPCAEHDFHNYAERNQADSNL